METTLFFERRKSQEHIRFANRRLNQRRLESETVGSEKRRPATRVRRFPRQEFKIPVRLVLNEISVPGYTNDISPEGLLVFSNSHFEPGTAISLKFSFAGNACLIKILGEVIFCLRPENDPVSGRAIGIKFSSIRDFEKQILLSAINELKEKTFPQENSVLEIVVSGDQGDSNKINHFSSSTVPQNENIGPVKLSGDEARNMQVFVKKLRLRKNRKEKEFSPTPPWVDEMNQSLEPYRQAIFNCKLLQETSTGQLPLEKVKLWNIQLYPFIESFPQFMALNLAKAPDAMARSFLIDNVKVEKKHADAWVEMAKGFGVPEEELFDARVLPEVEALTHWMWSINNRGTLVEGISATNFAIEGATQKIASIMVKGFNKYNGQKGVRLNKKAYWWAEAHSVYDDLHPLEALEIIKCHAISDDLRTKARLAAQRSLEYLFIALEACYSE